MAGLISLIVTTYNRPDALQAVLAALARQTDRGFEVMIADDGSGPATAALVDHWRSRLGVPLTHVWQMDRGFRLAEIRNRALIASRGDYSCSSTATASRGPFRRSHRALASGDFRHRQSRAALAGAPDRGYSRTIGAGRWPPRRWGAARLRGDINRLAAVLKLRLGPLRKLRADRWRGRARRQPRVLAVRSRTVDGFEAAFAGWGREDPTS